MLSGYPDEAYENHSTQVAFCFRSLKSAFKLLFSDNYSKIKRSICSWREKGSESLVKLIDGLSLSAFGEMKGPMHA